MCSDHNFIKFCNLKTQDFLSILYRIGLVYKGAQQSFVNVILFKPCGRVIFIVVHLSLNLDETLRNLKGEKGPRGKRGKTGQQVS